MTRHDCNTVSGQGINKLADTNIIYNMDCIEALRLIPSGSVHCCVTSPPYYGLRDYGMDGQIGREATPEDYIKRLVSVFGELMRVLRQDGTFWLNISDTYCGTGSKDGYTDPKYPNGRTGQNVSITRHVKGCKSKDLIGIPWLLAFALRNDGWYLRNDIIWEKGNPMPESVQDRCSRSYEHIFLLTKSKRYYFNALAIAEPRAAGTYIDETVSPVRNKRDVWHINTVPYSGAHFATFPPKLAQTCILSGCPENGIVIDPFFGSGTTGLVAKENNRRYIGIELNTDFCALAWERIGA